MKNKENQLNNKNKHELAPDECSHTTNLQIKDFHIFKMHGH